MIGHLWHLIAGAHYQRMYGEDFNPYLYELMPACSDHLHFAGSDWTKSRSGAEHDVLGGGHSHCGGMIYLGDNWPREYRQTMMMVNTHGHRLLYDKLARSGCGYVATQIFIKTEYRLWVTHAEHDAMVATLEYCGDRPRAPKLRSRRVRATAPRCRIPSSSPREPKSAIAGPC